MQSDFDLPYLLGINHIKIHTVNQILSMHVDTIEKVSTNKE